MIIEILYPELCCLYGDKGNTMFLQKCLPDAQFLYTSLNDRPHFLDEAVDLCCMYSMSEQSQEWILSRLLPLKDEVCACFHTGSTKFLFLGNALELLGQYIQREDGSKVEALGVFNIHSVRQSPSRFNTLMEETFKDMTLLGYSSRFSHTYGITEEIAFGKVTVGSGAEPDCKLEGIYWKNIIATYLLGPILVANPDFTKYLLKEIGIESPVLPFEQALYESYHIRRKEFQRPDLALD